MTHTSATDIFSQPSEWGKRKKKIVVQLSTLAKLTNFLLKLARSLENLHTEKKNSFPLDIVIRIHNTRCYFFVS